MYVFDIFSCMAASSSLAASISDGAASATAPSAVPYKEKASARACHAGNHKGLHGGATHSSAASMDLLLYKAIGRQLVAYPTIQEQGVKRMAADSRHWTAVMQAAAGAAHQ